MGEERSQYAIKYLNYQFYENEAFTKFLEEQSQKGYFLCGTIGEQCRILKFQYREKEEAKTYGVYRKHFDDQIEEEIQVNKEAGLEIACESNCYIIFAKPFMEMRKIKSLPIEEKQNKLLGIPLKKSFTAIAVWSIFLIMGIVMRIVDLEELKLSFHVVSLVPSIVLLLSFLCYFSGDIHDLLLGKARKEDGILYFKERSNWKEIAFGIGDILKFITVIGCILLSILFFVTNKDITLNFTVLSMWLVSSMGYVCGMKYHGSYVSLLIVAVFLMLPGFW